MRVAVGFGVQIADYEPEPAACGRPGRAKFDVVDHHERATLAVRPRVDQVVREGASDPVDRGRDGRGHCSRERGLVNAARRPDHHCRGHELSSGAMAVNQAPSRTVISSVSPT